MQDMRRSIIAGLIKRSQPDQMRQQMQNKIGAVNYPGYTPLNMPGQPMPQARPQQQAGMASFYLPTQDEVRKAAWNNPNFRQEGEGNNGFGRAIWHLLQERKYANMADENGWERGGWYQRERQKPAQYK